MISVRAPNDVHIFDGVFKSSKGSAEPFVQSVDDLSEAGNHDLEWCYDDLVSHLPNPPVKPLPSPEAELVRNEIGHVFSFSSPNLEPEGPVGNHSIHRVPDQDDCRQPRAHGVPDGTGDVVVVRDRVGPVLGVLEYPRQNSWPTAESPRYKCRCRRSPGGRCTRRATGRSSDTAAAAARASAWPGTAISRRRDERGTCPMLQSEKRQRCGCLLRFSSRLQGPAAHNCTRHILPTQSPGPTRPTNAVQGCGTGSGPPRSSPAAAGRHKRTRNSTRCCRGWTRHQNR